MYEKGLSMKPKTLALLGLIFAAQVAAPVLGHAQATHPAFTLVSRLTVTRPDGKKEVYEETRYVSSNGSVRAISKKADGTVSSDYLYESGRGGFYVNAQGKALVKSFGKPPEASDEPLSTAEQLRADPNFGGTEQLLGYTTYIIRAKYANGVRDRDNYYAPELGRTPLKVVRYSGDEVLSVSEPVSITLGEPDAAMLKMPEGYEVRPMAPISAGILNGKAVTLPAPVWPEGAGKVKGEVVVQVLVDEEGKVIEAKALEGPEQLRQAAVDAALKARFTPTKLSGRPVKVQGTLHYNFVRR
jgi:TonB family protein